LEELMEKKKRIGIIGCGTVVQKNYIRLFPRLKGIDINHVNDINEENARSVANNFKARVSTVKEVLENSDYVLIATPPRFHAEIVSQAIDSGVNIICEKPFVTSKIEAENLVEKAKLKGIQLYVAHFRRGYPSVQLARKIINTGLLGKVRKLVIVEGGRFNWDTKSDYIRKDEYGGVLFDTGSHTIDMTLFSAGLDQDNFQIEVLGVSREKNEPSHEIKAHFTIKNESSFIKAQLFLSRYQSLANLIRISGEKGEIELSVAYQTKIRLSGPQKSTMIYAENEYRSGADCMNMLYHQIFNSNDDDIYKAYRAITLSSILEKVFTN
jgi:predicted dehydrogenase